MVVRSVQLAAAACLVGLPFFLAIVWRPATTGRPNLVEPVARRVRLAAVIAAVALCLATVAELQQRPGATVTAIGRPLVWRMVLAACMTAARPWRTLTAWRGAVWGIGSALLVVTFSLTGHAAAALPQSPVPLLTDAWHVAAAAIWYGGLAGFTLLPWRHVKADARRAVGVAVQRFSRIGLLTMASLALSGLLLAGRYTYGVQALTEHPYGVTLFVKLGFVAGVLSFAAVNHAWVRPRLERDTPRRRAFGRSAPGRKTSTPLDWLRRLVHSELWLGLAVLLLAVRLAATAPPPGEPVRLDVTIVHDPAAAVHLAVPPRRPVRLTVRNPGGPPAGLYIPHIPGLGTEHGPAGDLQIMVGPGATRTVTFQAPGTGQYVIYYVGREGLRPVGWLLIER